ncbi:MAG: FHA domain-containing protein [Planctomycetes bacterium]|nr:FHA domain-containing protein [Planctomycetota bacterium]
MDKPLLILHEPTSGRRLRVEGPTVFGRAPALHDYAGVVGRAFGGEVLANLARLDFVEIEGDDRVSRTHGVLNPEDRSIRDLNSQNGVYVSGRKVQPTETNGEGPTAPVGDGDSIQIGRLVFRVEIAGNETSELALRDLWATRFALVGPSGDSEADEIEAFLQERKQFTTRSVASWDDLADAITRLANTSSEGTATVVIALRVEARGTTLVLSGEARPALWLVREINRLSGSKLVALQTVGDPRALEQIFANQAHQDALLLSSTVPGAKSVFEEPIENELCSMALGQFTGAKGGSPAAYHGIRDGLDAMIPADSNLLDLAWYVGYEGALTLTAGTLSPDLYEEIGTAYIATSGLCSAGRRYHFSSAPLPSSAPSDLGPHDS